MSQVRILPGAPKIVVFRLMLVIPTGILKYNTSTLNWGLCYDTGFIQNDVTTSQWNVKVNGGVDAGANPPCGDGLYKTRGNSSLLYNGNWVGGELNMNESESLN